MQRPLADAYGRVATDLRVSLTDRCNLRCSYCMPAEGLDWLPHRRGAHRRRGGAADRDRRTPARRPRGPVHRRRAADPAWPGRHRPAYPRARRRPRALGHHQRRSGSSAWRRRWPTAGLDRVNISLDTLDPARFKTITRRDRLDDVLRGAKAAHDAGLTPVKINAVLLRGVNDDEACELLAWAIAHEYELRFIEQMPLDAQHDWHRDQMVTADEIFERLGREFTLTPAREPRGSAPGRAVPGRRRAGDGRRDRLGDPPVLRRLRPGPAHRRRSGPQLPVRPRGVRPARRPAGRRRPTTSWPSGGWPRWPPSCPGHGINDPTFLQPDRPMSAIGG